MLALFSLAALSSAFLLFWVEPLFARLVLPLLGGSPAVWNTCLMFFQTLLLLGYLYAHASSRFLSPRRQVLLHVALLGVCMAALPLGLPGGWIPPGSGNVIPWLIAVLTVSLGAPFLVLSATAPLLQRWLASMDDPVENPYVLYAASNAGSFLGLLAFPLLLEPTLRLREQSVLWSFVYTGAFLLVALCGAVIWRRLPDIRVVASREAGDDSPPRWAARAKWVALAFVPSSLLLSVTIFLSTDVAATPMLWVIPLSLYLLTFVIVFSRASSSLTWTAAFMQALLVTTLVLVFFWQARIGFQRAYALHLGVFTFTALVLHGRLAASRPAPVFLTEYYLWMAFGGALGGAFTALVVPVIFESTRDYVMLVVIACFLRPTLRLGARLAEFQPRSIAFVLLPAFLLAIVSELDLEAHKLAGISVYWIVTVVAGAIALSLQNNALRFGAAIAAIAGVAVAFQQPKGTIYSGRSFFGIYRVALARGPATVLYHGTTIHGAQFLDSARRLTPITYYHPAGPVGQVFRALPAADSGRKVGIVGLGTGSILCYSKPGESWTFFEIDPQVEEIARNKDFFTFMSDCAAKPRVVLGDARLTLASEPDAFYSLLIVDAFSSDAIPVHLLTREAFALYRRKLDDTGVLLVHISNRRLNLEPVVGDLAQDGDLVALVRDHDVANERQDKVYDYGSDWVVLARRKEDLGMLASDTLWRALAVSRRQTPWTDDYSNLLSVIRW